MGDLGDSKHGAAAPLVFGAPVGKPRVRPLPEGPVNSYQQYSSIEEYIVI
jgi:hypothetical protein